MPLLNFCSAANRTRMTRADVYWIIEYLYLIYTASKKLQLTVTFSLHCQYMAYRYVFRKKKIFESVNSHAHNGRDAIDHRPDVTWSYGRRILELGISVFVTSKREGHSEWNHMFYWYVVHDMKWRLEWNTVNVECHVLFVSHITKPRGIQQSSTSRALPRVQKKSRLIDVQLRLYRRSREFFTSDADRTLHYLFIYM
jgi:hypothetical protein